MAPNAQSESHPLKAILNLRGRRARERVTQEVAHERLRVRRDVEGRARAHLGQLARRHVAYRVAAGLARRQPHVVEAAHDAVSRLGHLHEVELDVLPRRDVPEAARVLVGHVGEGVAAGPGPRMPMGILTRNICTSVCRWP